MTVQTSFGAAANSEAIVDLIASVAAVHGDLAALMDAIEDAAEGDGRCDIIAAIARSAKSQLKVGENAFDGITDFCRTIDMERIDREMAMADYADTDEGQALRDMAREIAQKIEAICHPAMRAITQMQNQAGEIDAMVRRARDMAGCLRWAHSPDRDSNKPEVGSLRATVEEAMAARPGSLSAVMERRVDQRAGWDRNDAR